MCLCAYVVKKVKSKKFGVSSDAMSLSNCEEQLPEDLKLISYVSYVPMW